MKRAPSKSAEPLRSSMTTINVTIDIAAIIVALSRFMWPAFWLTLAILGNPLARDAINSKPVALAQYIVREVEKPRPDGGALSGHAQGS